jgi:CheY-like chemotaxis protein
MTPGATASVLVVEDSDEDFDTVADAAARLQVPYALVRVLSVDDGLAALLSGQPFRLVILDNSLPGDRGDVFLSALRRHPLHCRVPVVAFTASGRQPERDALHAAGVNAFHVKSVNYEDNLWTLEMIFNYWLRAVAE